MTTETTTVLPKTGYRNWGWSGGLWLVLVAALGLVFADTMTAMFRTWLNSATFNHCILIPLIAAYLAWERREAFALITPRPAPWGLVFVFGAGVLWLMGNMVGAMVMQQFALVFMIQALALTLWGAAAARAMMLPLGYLLFMVPFGDFLVQPLQNVTADFSVWLLKAIGIPIFREGVFISTPTGEFHVAEACSGVRFLVAMLPLGVLLAAMAYRSLWRKAAIIAASVFIPIVANGIRAFGIIYIAYLTNNEYAVGVDHIIYGWIFFSFVTLLVIFVGMSFSDKPLNAPVADFGWIKPDDAAVDLKRLGLVAAAAFVLMLPWTSLAARAANTPGVALGDVFMPQPGGAWRAVDKTPVWVPKFVGADHEFVSTYRRADGAEVVFYFGYYESQHEDKELIQFGNGISPNRWDWNGSRQRTITLADQELSLSESDIADLRHYRRVWHWYWVGGHVTSSDYWAKFYHLLNRLQGNGDAAAVIALSTEEGAVPDDASALLQDFLNHLSVRLPGLDTLRSRDGS